jgi:hypothetical protein
MALDRNRKAHNEIREDEFNKCLELVKANSDIHFIEDLVSYYGKSRTYFYEMFPYESNNYNVLKEAIEKNKTNTKIKLRKKWAVDGNATTEIALYKLVGNKDDRDALNGKYEETRTEVQGLQIKSIPNFTNYIYTISKEWCSNREFALEISGRIDEFFNSDKKVLMIAMPQGAGKSFMANKMTEWLLGCFQSDKNKKSNSILRICNTDSNVTKFQASISNEVQSNEWAEIFGSHKLENNNKNGMRFVGSWNENAYFSGAKSSVMSRRADYIIFDDLYASMGEAMTATATNDYIMKFQTMWRGRLKGSQIGKIIMVGTRYTKNDFYQQICEMYSDSLEVITIPAIDSEGNSFCENTHPIAELLHDRDTMNIDLFNAIYQQNPTAEGFINPFEGMEIIQQPIYKEMFDYTCTVADPSFGVGGDYFMVGLFGYNKNGESGLIDLLCEKVCSDEMYIDFIDKHKCKRNFVENNGVGGMLINRVCNRTNTPLFPFHSIGNKIERIYMNANDIKKMVFNSEIEIPKEQLTNFGKEDHDDFPDVLSHFFNCIKVYGKE